MSGSFFLFYQDKNVTNDLIIILGKRSGKKEITFKGKLSFFDAVNMSDQHPPSVQTIPLQFISANNALIETFYFHDPHLSKKVKITFHQNLITVINTDHDMAPGSISNIFKYFLIKKGSRVLFITDLPNNKFKQKQNNKHLPHHDEKELN